VRVGMLVLCSSPRPAACRISPARAWVDVRPLCRCLASGMLRALCPRRTPPKDGSDCPNVGRRVSCAKTISWCIRHAKCTVVDGGIAFCVTSVTRVVLAGSRPYTAQTRIVFSLSSRVRIHRVTRA